MLANTALCEYSAPNPSDSLRLTNSSVHSRTKTPPPLEPVKLDVLTFECGEDEEKAFIDYMSDPQLYDSGHKITLFYRRNEDEPDAIENKILDTSYLDTDDKYHAVWDVVDELLPTIPHFYPTITGITLKTVGGRITAAFAEDEDEIIDYLPIPSHLSHVLAVPITELQRVAKLDMDVDRVKWQGRTYAFKKTGESLKGTLRELTILDKLSSSPYIIDLTAIVVNRDSITIRGFLSPFIHAGDLQRVFRDARQNRFLACADKSDATPLFDWSLRFSWACQITRGVVGLHAISAYNGDLKPKNVLIGSSGQAILIDLLPMGFSEAFTAPEVLQKSHDGITVLTASADVYSLGLLLYVVAEEKWWDIHPIEWRDTPGTSAWYREIVRKCLALDPDARPSAAEVLFLLEKGDGS